MIPKECKRLAEVDFPIAAVGKYALAEKATRTGTPNQLHYWWAWRPLAACRAMLMALLLPDPCDENCPRDFSRDARRALSGFSGGPTRWKEQMQSDDGLRHILLEFIADFANWDNAAKSAYLNTARALIKSAHPDDSPLVVDPFAGGGAIPLEALRLGCDAFASDLNPVACAVQKAKLDDVQRLGDQLEDDFRSVAKQVLDQSVEALKTYYPLDPDGARPMAYIWARTVRCEAPKCGAEIPLVRSFWLCKKANRKRALRPEVCRSRTGVDEIEFEVFEPDHDSDVPGGTVSRARATCLCCGNVLAPERVRAQISEQHGGADSIFDDEGRRIGGARMLAVVTLRPGETGRHYRLPTNADYRTIWEARQRLHDVLSKWRDNGRQGLCPVPDEPLPPIGTLGFRVQRYGMLQWGNLFSARQALAFATIAEITAKLHANEKTRCAAMLAALTISKLADRCCGLVSWGASVECPTHLFTGNALPIGWDFCESNLLGESSGSLSQSFDTTVANAKATVIARSGTASTQIADANDSILPDQSASIWFTDPPYYDNVPYSALSDFFLVWLKRAMPGLTLLNDPYDLSNPLSPKLRENIVDATCVVGDQPKDRDYFQSRMAQAFEVGRGALREDGVGCVVFAHKTTEGWEALLSGMVHGGWTITNSWPIETERSARMRARDSAALATSVHLVCRPRSEDAPVGDWGDVLRELPRRVADWMDRLQDEGIRGADLVFACIGPALEIFSRYSKVETAEGKRVPLAEYLAKVWEVVGRIALNQVLGTAEGRASNGAAGALEEDARLTALFLWTMQATETESRNGKTEGGEEEDDDSDEDEEDSGGSRSAKGKGFSLIYDVARRFAQPLGIHLEAWEDRIIKTEKGVVRLIPVLDRGKQLFGEDGASAIADRLERSPATAAAAQLALFPEPAAAPKVKGRGRGRKSRSDVSDTDLETRREATTLDRVHAAMLLQASGRANALRALLKAEIDRGPDFLRLSNALTALYPQGSDEKRLLDAMLLAVPR